MKGRARLHTSHVPSGLHFICFYVQALGLEFYPATLFINMCPFLPAPSVKGARLSGGAGRPATDPPPSPPFLFLFIIWPLSLSSRMTLKPCYWFSCHFSSYSPTLHLPLRRILKTQFGKKKKKDGPHDFRGWADRVALPRDWVWSAWEEVIEMSLNTHFWYEPTYSFICSWWLLQLWAPSSYWKEKMENLSIFFFV